jgi:hypothetical protein
MQKCGYSTIVLAKCGPELPVVGLTVAETSVLRWLFTYTTYQTTGAPRKPETNTE